MEALGYDNVADVRVENVTITPQNTALGGRVKVHFELVNQDSKAAALMVGFAIYFIKANGKANPKVFKLKAVDLFPNHAHDFLKRCR